MVHANRKIPATVSFPGYVIQHITQNPIEGESPNSRLRQVALMAWIFDRQVSSNPPTAASIAKTFGFTRAAVNRTLNMLVERGLLIETEGRKKASRRPGRRPYQYHVPKGVIDSALSMSHANTGQ